MVFPAHILQKRKYFANIHFYFLAHVIMQSKILEYFYGSGIKSLENLIQFWISWSHHLSQELLSFPSLRRLEWVRQTFDAQHQHNPFCQRRSSLDRCLPLGEVGFLPALSATSVTSNAWVCSDLLTILSIVGVVLCHRFGNLPGASKTSVEENLVP